MTEWQDIVQTVVDRFDLVLKEPGSVTLQPQA